MPSHTFFYRGGGKAVWKYAGEQMVQQKPYWDKLMAFPYN